MKTLIELLHTGGYSCVIENDEVRTFTRRGVADIHHLLKNEPDFLKGASVADKVVGKAAAALMVLGGVKQLYTDVISSPALNLLTNAGVNVAFIEEVPLIRNRDNTDWCPLEKVCYEEQSPEKLLPLIDQFIAKMKANSTLLAS